MEVLYLLSYGSMAPQAGFEPATTRLTAERSTTELLWNDKSSPATSYSRRGWPPTTIGAEELNFRVRNGNGCVLFAIVTEPTALNIHLCWLVPRNPSSLSSLVDAGTDLRRRKLLNCHL
jgi:hypothetical protein